ncbi:MAG: sigma-70 family RNA polymerase sigma factor [Chloroflexota bacterium]
MIPEQDLLAQAKEFDQIALAEIYDRYSTRLFNYAYRLLGDNCAAEDCVSETFSRFLQALRDGRGPRDYLQAYLFRAAHNIIVDHYRRTPAKELDDDLPDGSNVEHEACHNIRQRHVRAAMQKLTSDQQQVVALKFLEGWENDEIARALQKPIGAVKSLQHRALAHLQKILLDDEA